MYRVSTTIRQKPEELANPRNYSGLLSGSQSLTQKVNQFAGHHQLFAKVPAKLAFSCANK